MATFLFRLLALHSNYEPVLFSLATWFRDPYSVRLAAPNSWRNGAQLAPGSWRGMPYQHVGAVAVEWEPQRFRPRKVLTRRLNEFDLVQVVAGTPAWAWVANDLKPPVCLYVATTIREERTSLMANTGGWRRALYALTTRMNARQEPAALRRMSHVFALSRYTFERLQSHVPAGRLTLALPGINTDIFYPPAEYCAQGPIVSVGRFNDPRKNVRLLLAAYRQVRQTQPDAPRLWLIGDKPAPVDWTLAEQWGIAPFIDISVNLTPEELAPCYRQASLFVLPSNEEGLGIVILEAMASGLPVISTRCGGPETLVSEEVTGMLTPPGDVGQLADALLLLLQSPQRRWEMGQAGHTVAVGQYSLSAAGRRFLEVYHHLLT